MSRVVDTCVVIAWYAREEGSDAAAPFLGTALIAPTLLRIELANVLWKKVRAAEIAPVQAAAILAEAQSSVTLVAVERLAARALEIAIELCHPAYDCLFVALAEEQETRLVTADRKLAKACRGTPYAALVQLI